MLKMSAETIKHEAKVSVPYLMHGPYFMCTVCLVRVKKAAAHCSRSRP